MHFCVLHRNLRWPPKWREGDFWGKLPVDSAYTPWVETFVEIALSHTISETNALVFYTEIPDSRQKWRESESWEKSSVDPACTLWVKNFVEIALSHTVSEINVLLRFTQKFKMATKSGGKVIL